MSSEPTTTQEAGQPQLTHKQILLVFSGLMLGMLLAALDQTVLATALPTIVGELSGIEHLSWVITAYLLTATTSVLLYGKLSDIYGRKLLFQFAILVFVIGSALSGGAQSMTQLIIFRGIQGLGAGGIMSMSQSIIADITTPRERGRYMGYMGVVFAFSSIVGPLLGGFFTQALSWRWVFFINLPLGAITLLVTTKVLHLHHRRLTRKIDFTGAALVVAGASCILLALTWAGRDYAWGSATIVGLLSAGIVLSLLFVYWELRAEEPVLPLRLFQNSIFSATSAISLVVGMAMFGTIAFLPAYLQIVKDQTPTASGLRLLPMMVGMVSMSIISGRILTATGRYRRFPIAGTILITTAILLLSQLRPDSSWWHISGAILLLGMGMGCIMQVVTVAMQNSVERQNMGTATAALNFFRSIGGVLGVALFGAILSSRLSANLPRFVPNGQDFGLSGGSLRFSPEELHRLPPNVVDGVAEAFSRSIDTVFLWAAPVAVVAFVLTLFLKEVPLQHRWNEGPAAKPEADSVSAGIGD